VRTFPRTEFYDLEQTLTSLGIGEAVVTALDARGVPTPVVATRLIPPSSRMAPLTPEELQADIRSSDLLAEYGNSVDRDSAREMLARRIEKTAEMQVPAAPAPSSGAAKVGRVLGGALLGSLAATVGRTVGRELVRGVFGMLGGSPPRAPRRRTRW
jgi:hypothetical protein